MLRAKKKVVLFPEIGRLNVNEDIPFLFQKTHTRTKRFQLAHLLVRIYGFSLQKIKDRALCFSTKKRVVF